MQKADDDTNGGDVPDVLGRAIQNSRDCTGTFFADFGHDPVAAEELQTSEAATKLSIRAMMKKSKKPYSMFNMDEMAAEMRQKVSSDLDAGLVAAVDGTNAVDPSDMMLTGLFGCAVGFTTSKKRSTPVVRVTKTTTKYAEPRFIERMNSQQLQKYCEHLDEIQEQRSWTTAYREYMERDVALSCGAPTVIIDGPIFTHDTAIRPQGRALLDRINRESNEGRVFIGIIKSIVSAKSTLLKWCAYSLLEREGYVLQGVSSKLVERLSKHKAPAEAKWAEGIPDDWVRVVFRPRLKSFALECRLRDLPYAMGLVIEDASPTLNHELPLLLETVDAQIRAGFDSQAARRILLGRLQQIDLHMGVDLTDEREYR